jgi:hypothetical protein
MVLKEMHLPTATYEGSPVEPVGEVQHASSLITQPRPGSEHIELLEEAASDEESRSTRFTVSDD